MPYMLFRSGCDDIDVLATSTMDHNYNSSSGTASIYKPLLTVVMRHWQVNTTVIASELIATILNFAPDS